MAAFSRKIHAVNSHNARYNRLIVINHKEFQIFLWYVSTHEKVAKTLEYECCYRFQDVEKCAVWAKNDNNSTKFPLDFFWKHDVYYYQRNRFRKMKELMCYRLGSIGASAPHSSSLYRAEALYK